MNEITRLRRIYKKILYEKPLNQKDCEVLEKYGFSIEKYDGGNGFWMAKFRNYLSDM